MGYNFFPVKGTGTPPQSNTGPANPFTGFIPGMTGSFAPGYTPPTASQTAPQTTPKVIDPTTGDPSPTTGQTEPNAGSFNIPQQNTGLFKFGGESSFKPIQQVPQQQGPRYRINEAMMRSPYYNPYFSSFQ